MLRARLGQTMALTGLLLAGGVASAAPVEVTQLRGIYADSATRLERQAATTLQSGMHLLYGVKLAVATGAPPARAEGWIVLGERAGRAVGGLTEADLKAVGIGGHVLRCGDGAVVIAGPDRWATLFGVYAFLERLGLHYFERGRYRLAKPQGTILAPFTVSDRPVFPVRAGPGPELRSTSGAFADPRKGLNRELYEKDSDLWIDHSAGYLLPKKLFYDTHPEYYAMLENGRRIAKDAFSDHRTPLCFSNPDVSRIAAERALAWIGLQPDALIFMITNGDGGWCQCPACNALDHAPQQHARRLLRWANRVVQPIGEQYPGRITMTFAYGGSDIPPPDVAPVSSLWICGSTGAGNIEFWDHAVQQNEPRLKAQAAKIDLWLKPALGRYVVCEYHSGVYTPALVETMQGRLRWYAARGMKGVLFTYGHPKNFSALWLYLHGRLLWNPEQDAGALANDFIEFTYGEAAAPLKRFLALSRQRYRETLGRNLVDGYPAAYYEDTFADPCVAAFDEARKRAAPALRPVIAKEQKLFVMDWMEHPVSTTPSPESKARFGRQLDCLGGLAGTGTVERVAFAREVHALGVGLERTMPGSLSAVEEWMQRQAFPRPKAVVTATGIELPPESFMFAGYGPGKYGGGATPAPPKTAVGIYVEGNAMARSHKMEAEFDLESVPGDGTATLEVEAQDCDHDVPPAIIRVEINGKRVYEGQVLVVKHNWSKQEFSVARGILQPGRNTVRFTNVTDPASVKNWFERWYMLAGARIAWKAK